MSRILSQGSLAAEIATWSNEKCEEEIATVVPKLLGSISQFPCSLEGLIESIPVLAEKFLAATFQEDLGTRILDTVSSQLTLAFDNTLAKLPSDDVAKLSQETPASMMSTLQDAIKVLQCSEGIVRQLAVVISGAIAKVKLADISKVPDAIILILNKSYGHCKASEKIYGKYFKFSSKFLGILFQKTFSLQKTFSFMLGSIKYSPEDILRTDETKRLAVTTCCGLLSICKIVSGMDNLLLGSTWKLLVAFLSEFQDLVKTELHAEQYLGLLQENILQCVKYSVRLYEQSWHLISADDEPTKKALSQSLKFSSFFMSSLSECLKVFHGYLNGKCHHGIVAFLCELHSALKPRQVSPHGNRIPDDIVKFHSELLPSISGYETITEVMMSEESFIAFFAKQDWAEKYKPSYGFLQMLLTMCKVLTGDSAILHKWFISSSDYQVSVIFLMKLTTEQALQTREYLNILVYHRASPHSLYNSLIIHLCALLSCLSNKLYKLFENELIFSNLFSHDPLRSILACDVLVFICTASKPLYEHYTTILCEILKACTDAPQLSFPFQMVVWTLRRLKHQEKGLPCSSNKWPWAVVPLPHDTAQPSLRTVLPHACRKIEEDIASSSVDILHLSRATQHCLRLLSCAEAVQGRKLQPSHRNLVNKTQASLIKLWVHLRDGVVSFGDSICMSKFLVTFFYALKIFIRPDSQELVKIVSSIDKIFNDKMSPVIKMKIVEIISKIVENSTENLDPLCGVFLKLISDTDWRVRCSALRAFEVVSSCASGTNLLKKCIAIPHISSKIEEHLSFTCVEPVHDSKYILEQQKTFASLSVDDVYKNMQSRQNLSLQRFVSNYQLPSTGTQRYTTTSFAHVFARVQESVSELERLCATQHITKDDIDSSTRESLRISCNHFRTLSKKFGV